MTTQELILFKQKALIWANEFEVCCCFDSHGYTDPYSKYDFLLAAGAAQQLHLQEGTAFSQLKDFYADGKQWMFGLMAYDLKNELEDLHSSHQNPLDFPGMFFFVPQYVIAVTGGEIQVHIGSTDLLDTINAVSVRMPDPFTPSVTISQRLSKAEYISKVEQLRGHIAAGDIYELNFCQEFFARNAAIDPYQVYLALSSVSPTPFSGYFKSGDKYVLSASPERYLCKRGDQLYSQPIKGTAKRSANPQEDEMIREQLRNNLKERAENVMIVDLVRNDLTKNALKGTVKVKELFGIYSFPQVHQMISTISCTLDPGVHPVQAIANTFPMGSMTGAPKLRAMELIEATEVSRRGMYSGAMGYFDHEGDFDFNVVIRSILYNQSAAYLSFQVGGAITYASDARAEYEECLLKASAIISVLNSL